MLFDGWLPLLRTAVVGILAYAALVFFLRVSGKRTLSKMNAFDLIVTVALGSTLATVLLSSTVSLATGALAFALLIGLQYAVTWLSVRSPVVRGFVKGEPTMLVHRGNLLEATMRRERVTEDEILAALRSEGVSDLSNVEALVLETDSSFSVLTSKTPSQDSTSSTLASVSRREDHRA
jgi:uncharacterized membrane protein YcaP (DUF421 family)